MWKPTRLLYGEGRRPGRQRGYPSRRDTLPGFHRGIGGGMPAEEIRRNTGSLGGEGA